MKIYMVSLFHRATIKYPDVEQEREISKRHLSKRELESFFATGIGGTTRRPV